MYKIVRTSTFFKNFKKYRKDFALLVEIEKKIIELKKDPHKIGHYLCGDLKGYKSTRIKNKYRIIFRIDKEIVYLIAIDHREFVY